MTLTYALVRGYPYSRRSPEGFFLLRIRRPARCTVFPYTTLFRSSRHGEGYGLHVGSRLPVEHARRSAPRRLDRQSTRLNPTHGYNSYAVFCLKKLTRLSPLIKTQRVGHSNQPLKDRHFVSNAPEY